MIYDDSVASKTIHSLPVGYAVRIQSEIFTFYLLLFIFVIEMIMTLDGTCTITAYI